MPVALAALVALSASVVSSPSVPLAGSAAYFDFESDMDAASRLYDAGDAKGALAKIVAVSKKYPTEYKENGRLYHLEIALVANEQQGRVFMKSLISGSFASDWRGLSGIAPAVEHLKVAQPATWTMALNAGKRAAQLNAKSAEAQEAIGISHLGLKNKPAAKAAFEKAVALAKRDARPDAGYISWLAERRTKLALRKF